MQTIRFQASGTCRSIGRTTVTHNLNQPSRTRSLHDTPCSRATGTRVTAPHDQRNVRVHAIVDVSPAWTLDQIAGLAFGGVMLGFYVSAQQVDIYFAKAQRKQLGLCEECGGVFNPKSCTEKVCPMRKVSEYSISEKGDSK